MNEPSDRQLNEAARCVMESNTLNVLECKGVMDGICVNFMIVGEQLAIFYAGPITQRPNETPLTGSSMAVSPNDFAKLKQQIDKRRN